MMKKIILQRESYAYRIRFNSVAVRAAGLIIILLLNSANYFRSIFVHRCVRLVNYFERFGFGLVKKTSPAQTAQSPTNPHLKHAKVLTNQKAYKTRTKRIKFAMLKCTKTHVRQYEIQKLCLEQCAI
jgi:hypothetical protein